VRQHLTHGKFCIVGLVLLQAVRMFAWYENMLPILSVIGMHCLSVTSDIGCICCTLPFYASTLWGSCLKWACIGPMVTMLFSLGLVDVSGLLAFLYMAPRRPFAPGFVSIYERLEAVAGVWEMLFFASVALQLTLLTASWRIYKQMRLAGLYPPGNDSIAKGETLSHVSMLEATFVRAFR